MNREHLLLVMAMALLLVALSPAQAEADAEFDGQCVMGLAGGTFRPTDCTTTWKDRDGKRYCFGDQQQLDTFLAAPEDNLRKAREFHAAGEAATTAEAMNRFQGAEVKAFVEASIASSSNAGAFPLPDPMTGKELKLVFEKIDFMRTLHGYGFFPEAIFHDHEDETRKYLIDFWVKPRGKQLEILDTRIYKGPKREGNEWVLKARTPKPWWWIPASEHPGETEEKRAWEVMSAIEQHIVGSRAASGGAYHLRDDKTGEDLVLEFIGTHQPVRRLSADGRYFACTDFRRQGSTEEYYDVDFWLDEKNGRIEVGDVRVHKVPVLEDGSWVQVPRYSFDDLKFDIVP